MSTAHLRGVIGQVEPVKRRDRAIPHLHSDQFHRRHATLVLYSIELLDEDNSLVETLQWRELPTPTKQQPHLLQPMQCTVIALSGGRLAFRAVRYGVRRLPWLMRDARFGSCGGGCFLCGISPVTHDQRRAIQSRTARWSLVYCIVALTGAGHEAMHTARLGKLHDTRKLAAQISRIFAGCLPGIGPGFAGEGRRSACVVLFVMRIVVNHLHRTMLNYPARFSGGCGIAVEKRWLHCELGWINLARYSRIVVVSGCFGNTTIITSCPVHAFHRPIQDAVCMVRQ